MTKTVHYCNGVADIATCCALGGHRQEPIDEGFDDPRCTCPPYYRTRYCSENGVEVPPDTCGSCWHNASMCGCREPLMVINPTTGVSYRATYTVSIKSGAPFKFVRNTVV